MTTDPSHDKRAEQSWRMGNIRILELRGLVRPASKPQLTESSPMSQQKVLLHVSPSLPSGTHPTHQQPPRQITNRILSDSAQHALENHAPRPALLNMIHHSPAERRLRLAPRVHLARRPFRNRVLDGLVPAVCRQRLVRHVAGERGLHGAGLQRDDAHA